MKTNKVVRAFSSRSEQTLKTTKVCCLNVINLQKMPALYYYRFLTFYQISGSCFYKIDHYMALFLKTFSLAVSLNSDKLQVISAETEK